ncbi:MAG: hypothetical protein LBS92_07565 [Candidatus Methanoplasma sp.]|nr:hypothetical protein [Candidatus Methanoplasma sp.]
MNLDDFSDEIFVLDTETTGLDGGPCDVVVDVGVCAVDLFAETARDVYSSIVGYDVSKWDDRRKNAWIFKNTDLTVDMVAAATPQPDVRADLARILRGKRVTAYNVPFDMDKFLYREPWGLRGLFRECTDIMAAATEVCKLPSQLYGCKYRFPKLDHAYSAITEGDPAGIEGKQDHRALSDARMASQLMIRMFRDLNYSP